MKPSEIFLNNFRRLFEAYKASGGTQVLLAEAMGVNQSQISAWLKGTKPTLDQLPGLAQALSVSVDSMLTEDGWKQRGSGAAASLPADVAALARDLAALDEDKRHPLMAGFTAAVEYQLSLARSKAAPKRQKQP